MQVLKFGGTSVGSAERIRKVAELINYDGEKIVVLSAMSGTTNTLVEICDCLYKNDKQKADVIIKQLESKYSETINDLFKSSTDLDEIKQITANIFSFIRSFINQDFCPLHEKSILAQGELLSTNIMYSYLRSCGINASFLPALNYMRIDKDGEPDLFYIKQNIERELSLLNEKKIIITQGFICRNVYGKIDNLKRGGSDYSAALVGQAINADEIQIWTDIDGFHNNDPRIVSPTKAIRHLSFDQAAELAYFGAKILHPSSVQPAKQSNIPVRLKNTLNPNDEGTLICNCIDDNLCGAVAAKDGITSIKIKSTNMLLAYGFLRKVFEVFETWKTPIDMIATSEVTVSTTIDCTTNLEHIVNDLKQYGSISVESDLSIICIVGDFSSTHVGMCSKVFNALSDIPLNVISYGGSEHSISFLVKTSDKKRALENLNIRFLNNTDK